MSQHELHIIVGFLLVQFYYVLPKKTKIYLIQLATEQ